MTKRIRFTALAFLSASAVVAGCGGGDDGEADLWVMVTDQAGLGDQGFNDLAWAGVERAASEFGGEPRLIESDEQAQYVPNLQEAVDSGAALVVGVGFLLTEAIGEVALSNPDATFLLIDAVAADADGDPLPNVRSVTFKEHEGAYLAGVIAGMTTETDEVGFVGGIEIPPVVRYLSGFEQGLASVNPDAAVETAYAGSFDDPVTATQLTAASFDRGADIIFEVSGAGGLGVYEEAVERGSGLVVGTDTCKDQLAPGRVLTSATKDVTGAVFTTAASVADDTFEGGIADLGLSGGFVGVCEDTFGDLPQEVQEAVDAARDAIAAGEVTVEPGA